jgi:hypothetical protein
MLLNSTGVIAKSQREEESALLRHNPRTLINLASFTALRSSFSTAAFSLARVAGCTRSPRRNRSVACCDAWELSHELPKRITSCSDDDPSVGGPSLRRLLAAILDWSGISKNTNIFTLLCSSLNFLPDIPERNHCLNGASQKKPLRV